MSEDLLNISLSIESSDDLLKTILSIESPEDLAHKLLLLLDADLCVIHIRPSNMMEEEGEFLDIEYRKTLNRQEVLEYLSALLERKRQWANNVSPSKFWKDLVDKTEEALVPILYGLNKQSYPRPEYPCLAVCVDEFGSESIIHSKNNLGNRYKAIKRAEITPDNGTKFTNPSFEIENEHIYSESLDTIKKIARYHLGKPKPFSFVSIPVPVKEAYRSSPNNVISIDISWLGKVIPSDAPISEAIILTIAAGSRVVFPFLRPHFEQLRDHVRWVATSDRKGHVEDEDIQNQKETANGLHNVFFPCRDVFNVDTESSYKALYYFPSNTSYGHNPDKLSVEVLVKHLNYLEIGVELINDDGEDMVRLPCCVGMVFILCLFKFFDELNKEPGCDQPKKVHIKISQNNKVELGIPLSSCEPFWHCFHTSLDGGAVTAFRQLLGCDPKLADLEEVMENIYGDTGYPPGCYDGFRDPERKVRRKRICDVKRGKINNIECIILQWPLTIKLELVKD